MESDLKILHLSTYDEFGGAARAAQRIMAAQLSIGINCDMQCLLKTGNNSKVSVPQNVDAKTKLKLVHDYLQYLRNYDLTSRTLSSYGDISAGLVDEINQSSYDIINLHWIAYMLSIEDIGRINKTIVWTLHDMWAFCGGEHSISDEKQLENYLLPVNIEEKGNPGSAQNKNLDAWQRKAENWQKKEFIIICPSNWLARLSKKSKLLSAYKTYVVPHPIDTSNLWVPSAKGAAREQFNLPAESKLLLFSTNSGILDPIKGWDLLVEALQKFFKNSKTKNIELMVAGNEMMPVGDDFPCRIHWLGKLNSDETIAKVYAAADVILVPSRLEAFSQVGVEAQSCGVPVVAFNNGGPAEIILHQHTGWLAKPYNTDEFSEGIAWILESDTRYSELSAASRTEAVNRYSQTVIADKYKKIYEEITA